MRNLLTKILDYFRDCQCQTLVPYPNLSLLHCERCGSIYYTNSAKLTFNPSKEPA